MRDKALERIRRPLTKHECELIAWLIDHSSYQEPDRLRTQVNDLSVNERCTCGCPTIYFAHAGVPVERKGERLISDHLATVEGEQVGVMLFETEGKLSSLEVYSCGGSTSPFGLPQLDDLHVSSC